jgi:hypothetical protein
VSSCGRAFKETGGGLAESCSIPFFFWIFMTSFFHTYGETFLSTSSVGRLVGPLFF